MTNLHALVQLSKHTTILIGGATGVGKTTTAHTIACRLGISCHFGTDYIRQTLRTLMSKDSYPELFQTTYKPAPSMTSVEHFLRQSEPICRAVVGCVNRAHEEKMSLVIEGNHLLPEYIQHLKVDAFVILKCPTDQHFHRLRYPTNKERLLTEQDLHNIKENEELIISQASKFDIPIIDNFSLDDTIQKILELLGN